MLKRPTNIVLLLCFFTCKLLIIKVNGVGSLSCGVKLLINLLVDSGNLEYDCSECGVWQWVQLICMLV